ncbi:unnamed protein product [Urochloa humidicola]
MAGKGAPSEVVVFGKAEGEEELKASAVAAVAGSSEGVTAPAPAPAAAAAAGGGPSDAGKAAAADSSAVAAADGGEAKEAGTKLVELPERHVRWILAQEMRPVFSLDDFAVTSEVIPQKFRDKQLEHLSSARESLLASQDDFSKYQAWMREVYEREGRVMVPEHVYPQIDEAQEELNRISLQEEVDLIFAQAAEDLERDHPELVALIAEVEGKTDEDVNPICGTAPPNCG